MTLTVLHMGKVRIPFVRSGVDHFRRKIRPYATLSLVAVKEEALRKGVSVREVQRKEKDRLKKAMDNRHVWLVLDERGKRFGSEAFASLMQRWIHGGNSRIGFLVGGPCGLDPEIKDEAKMTLSVSPMTFSHEVTLLVLLEQLYRALAVLNGLPYPK